MAFKLPNNHAKAAKLLCSGILKLCGGSSAIANSMGHNRQYVHAWLTKGCVPLKQVDDVSAHLNVPHWMLSYVKLATVFGVNSPSLKDLIKDSPLPSADKDRLISYL